ncbi:MAG: DUF5694 domain-containing protein [Marinifilaceae bacterium]
MKNIVKIAFTTLLISIMITACQTTPSSDSKGSSSILSPSDFFKSKIGKRPQILTLGVFHFNYPGRDYHKTDESKKLDVLSPKRQIEIRELLEYIKKFKPTKIGIEVMNGSNMTSILRKYNSGKIKLKRDEGSQIGIRLASELNLDTIYSLDASHFALDLYKRDSIFSNKMYEGFDYNGNDPVGKYYDEWAEIDNDITYKMPLLDYFKYSNTREIHNYMYGSYLIGGFKLDDHRGADILAAHWYNRNLRIFRKIQQLNMKPDDRLLIIFGNAHAAVLRQLIECSPEYEFVEFDSLK